MPDSACPVSTCTMTTSCCAVCLPHACPCACVYVCMCSRSRSGWRRTKQSWLRRRTWVSSPNWDSVGSSPSQTTCSSWSCCLVSCVGVYCVCVCSMPVLVRMCMHTCRIAYLLMCLCVWYVTLGPLQFMSLLFCSSQLLSNTSEWHSGCLILMEMGY